MSRQRPQQRKTTRIEEKFCGTKSKAIVHALLKLCLCYASNLNRVHAANTLAHQNFGGAAQEGHCQDYLVADYLVGRLRHSGTTTSHLISSLSDNTKLMPTTYHMLR